MAGDFATDHELWARIGIDWSSEENESCNDCDITHQPTKYSFLSMTLEPKLLRATSLVNALRGWCRHWDPNSATGDAIFEHSRPVDSIDVFLSHEWVTSRWMKLALLLVAFNSRAAAVTSMLLSLLMGFAQAFLGTLLPLHWWILCGYMAFAIQFCFWQRIRGYLRCAPCLVFLDKLCIHQTNIDLKEQGIKGLGAFVNASEKLLVLWSHRYFTRLWCVYEIACFLSRSKRVTVELLPVKTSVMLVLLGLVWHLLMFSYNVIRMFVTNGDRAQYNAGHFVVIAAATVSVATALLPVLNYLGMSLMDDVEELPRQVKGFRVQDSQCACCSNDHKHPQTGEDLMCDRELVYRSLKQMYGRDDVGDELEKFNQLVQETFGPKVLWRLGTLGTYFPLQYVVCVIMSSNIPILSHLIWQISLGPEGDVAGLEYVVWLLRLILWRLQPLLAILFSLELSVRLWKIKSIFPRIPRSFLALLLSPIQSILVSCVFASMELAVRFSDETSLIPLVPFFLGCFVNAILHLC